MPCELEHLFAVTRSGLGLNLLTVGSVAVILVVFLARATDVALLVIVPGLICGDGFRFQGTPEADRADREEARSQRN
jgi:hypothetical protein